MIKRMIIMLVLVGAGLGGLFWFQSFKGKMMMQYMAAAAEPPQTVSTAKAKSEEWQSTIKAVGTVKAVKGADLAAEVGGIVESIAFDSGDEVEEGKILLHLRDADEAAKVDSLRATLKLAEITLDRDMKQLKAQAVSQAMVDQDIANLNSARAQLAQQEAVLAKKTVRAPFSGRIGVRAVDVGQYLNAGTTIVTLQQLDPIYIDFSLPQQNLKQLEIGQKVSARSDAHPEKAFEGEIAALDAKVDSATRNITIRASFKNPDKMLLPGMFANVSILSGQPQKLITVPQTAITYNPYGNTVFVVDETGTDAKGKPQTKARQTFVTTGESRGDQIAVLTGLKEGDEIVSSGQLKLQNGTPIIVNNSVQPSNDAAPKPVDK